jgi:N-methylhydantoinase A
MQIDLDKGHAVIESLARKLNRSVVDTALGITRVAENNMGHAVRAITSRRGVDPRVFVLLSFGGAGGLHACAVAESLDIPRVLAPPFCGVLSALGMVVAPPVADAARTVVHMGAMLDNDRMAAEYGSLSAMTMDVISYEDTASVQALADVRFEGQSHELTVQLNRPSREHMEEEFKRIYEQRYGLLPTARRVQIVTLRVRRIGRQAEMTLPTLVYDATDDLGETQLTSPDGKLITARAVGRAAMIGRGAMPGPLLLIDAQATTFVPPGWTATASNQGLVLLANEK